MEKVYTYEELLINDSFIAWCTTSNAAEASYWAHYLEQFPEEAAHVNNARIAVQQLHEMLLPLAADQAAEAFRQLLQANQPEARVYPIRHWYTRVAIAAAIIVTGAAGGYWWLHSSEKNEPAAIIQSMPGERKSVVLADGTKVILNANSQLMLHPHFKQGMRDLTLQGEAYFDVQQDAQHPFVIHTTHMDVKVLGTSFNIMAYKNDTKTATSLISGAVEVIVKGENGKRIVLQPNEKVTLDNTGPAASNHTPPAFQLSKVNVQANHQLITETAWINDKLAFQDETLEEVAHKLERWYGVDIKVDSTIAGSYHYTAVFEKETLPQALHILQLILPFQYTIHGTVVTISKQ